MHFAQKHAFWNNVLKISSGVPSVGLFKQEAKVIAHNNPHTVKPPRDRQTPRTSVTIVSVVTKTCLKYLNTLQYLHSQYWQSI